MASTITNNVPVATTCLKLRVQAGGVRYQPIDVEITEPIGTVKQKVERITGIPAQRQKWAVPGSGAINVQDDSNPIGSVLECNSSLRVQDSSSSTSQSDSQGSFQGHQWQVTMANQTHLVQGDTIDASFYGQAPQGRGHHQFEYTRSDYGNLRQGDQYRSDGTVRHSQSNYAPQQGDQYRSGESAPPQHTNPHRNDSSANGRANAGGPQHRGNTYGETTTRNTNHNQGDIIQAGWHGQAPANAGNHHFGVTDSKGGSLHQGNKFGHAPENLNQP
ncbi:hypothetical protein NCS56_01378600 [Fusarium sp. Ph1]|nr:hypothetical protein NCS56_01378600 [Fusarium sp. Ph1]